MVYKRKKNTCENTCSGKIDEFLESFDQFFSISVSVLWLSFLPSSGQPLKLGCKIAQLARRTGSGWVASRYLKLKSEAQENL